jgi:hypothetical protein
MQEEILMHETFSQVFMKLSELGEFDDFEKLEALVDAELK